MDRSRRRSRALRLILAAALGLGIVGGIGVAVGIASAQDTGPAYTTPTQAPSQQVGEIGPDDSGWQ